MKKRPFMLAFLLGICATLTLPPFYLFPLIVPAYGGLFLLLNRAPSAKQALKLGFFWGWGFYITGLYWFCIALLTDPEKFAWLIPFALFALTAVIALYTALFSVVYFKFRRGGVAGAVLFAALWTLVEFARGHLFTGFPWNLAGYVFAVSNASIQLASLVNIYGLTFITVFIGVIGFAHRRAALLSVMLLVAAIGWGARRVETAPHDTVAGVTLRLVQGNIPQHLKWNPDYAMEGLRRYIDISHSAGLERVTHIIWPESAVPFLMYDKSTLAVRLGETILPHQTLITGVLRGEGEDVTNSLVAINAKGKVTASYNKHALVPFGEFLPLRRFLPDAITTPVGMHDLAAGEGPKTLAVPGLPPVSPLICYEVIFPESAVEKGAHPEWLLSITNDAWFGNSTGPYQHLAAARMRAVEQGLPMVRVANTGITAVYDAYGREAARIPLGAEGFVDVALPAPVK